MNNDINASKEDLILNEEKYRNLFNYSQIGMFRSRLDGSEGLEANQKFLSILGLKREEFVGKSSINYWADTKERESLVKILKSKNKVTDYEFKLLNKAGEIRNCVASMVLYPETGILEGSIIDITDRIMAESQIKNSEIKYKTLYESSIDALMTLEPPMWKFTSGNESALKMFKAKDEAEFTSAEPWRLSPEKQPDGRLSAEKAKEMIEIAMRDGSNFFEWTHKRLDGEDFPASVLLTRIELDGKGFLQATVRDITFQKNIENKLKENERKYRLLTENSSDCIKLFDLQGNLLFMNNGGKKEHFLDIDADIKNFKIIDTISDEDKPKFKEFFEKAKNGISSVVELRHTKEGASREICSEMFQPVTDDGGKVVGVFGVSRDITKIKKVEEDLYSKIVDLEKINKFLVGRELKMIELKKEIEALKAKD